MGWLIGSILFFIEGFIAIYAYKENPDDPSGIVAIIVIFLLAIWLFVKYRNSKNGVTKNRQIEKNKKKQEQKKAQEVFSRTLLIKHQAGLPLAQETMCNIVNEENCFKISASGNNFELKKDKITAIDVKTDMEIHRQYVSSAGGAIAGGLAFGTLGAIVGGRVKEKKTTTVTYYLIFTYRSNEQICYASFELPYNYLKKAREWAKEFGSSEKVNMNTIQL